MLQCFASELLLPFNLYFCLFLLVIHSCKYSMSIKLQVSVECIHSTPNLPITRSISMSCWLLMRTMSLWIGNRELYHFSNLCPFFSLYPSPLLFFTHPSSYLSNLSSSPGILLTLSIFHRIFHSLRVSINVNDVFIFKALVVQLTWHECKTTKRSKMRTKSRWQRWIYLHNNNMTQYYLCYY